MRAGLSIIDAVARLGPANDRAVRIGIATGLVFVGDLIGEGPSQEQAVVGETPNLAAGCKRWPNRARSSSLMGPVE